MDNVTREVNVLYTSCCHWTLELESTVIMIVVSVVVTAARTDQDTAVTLLAAGLTGHLGPGPGPELDTRLLLAAAAAGTWHVSWVLWVLGSCLGTTVGRCWCGRRAGPSVAAVVRAVAPAPGRQWPTLPRDTGPSHGHAVTLPLNCHTARVHARITSSLLQPHTSH